MEQVEYKDIYKGKPRKLLILKPQEGTDYRVFCESSFIGLISNEQEGEISIWKTEYNLLKPVVKKIGLYIESLNTITQS